MQKGYRENYDNSKLFLHLVNLGADPKPQDDYVSIDDLTPGERDGRTFRVVADDLTSRFAWKGPWDG